MSTLEALPSDQNYSYDAVPYPSHPYDVTHPDNIYAIARLFGVPAALPDTAKILEIGCASGGNLLPIALQLPNSQCIGVDLSSKQIEDGSLTIEACGIKNAKLFAQSFEDVDPSYGQFDYILCHGVFSWIPPEVQKKMFEFCRDRLAPNGIAYISYNAYPGWFMRRMIREMMLHHVKLINNPKEKVQQARALLQFIVDSTEGQTTPYAQGIKSELELLSKQSDSYLFHEHLEENNNPMFFYQFMEMAKPCGLQFLSETSLASMVTSNLPAKAAESLSKLTNDLYHRSQYTDFVTNRMFRQTLLCHSNVQVHRHLTEASIDGIHLSGIYEIEEPQNVGVTDPNVEVGFKCTNGRKLRTKHPALKAIFFTLNEAWPTAISMEELVERVATKCGPYLTADSLQPDVMMKLCRSLILQTMVRGDVDFRFTPSRFTNRISERPKVSALARHQSQLGLPIATQKHQLLNPDAVTRLMMQSIDGTRTKADLIEILEELIESGRVRITIQNGNDHADLKPAHAKTIERVLDTLRVHALLES